MNADHLIYTEHNIECWVERQIDRLDAKYQLDQISTSEYNDMMQEIYRQAESFYNRSHMNDLQANDTFVYEL